MKNYYCFIIAYFLRFIDDSSMILLSGVIILIKVLKDTSTSIYQNFSKNMCLLEKINYERFTGGFNLDRLFTNIKFCKF